MFSKILIANRGEIACRVIRSARAMGIRTVAVYSDADREARHVAEADEAIHIGAAAASESYLLEDRIIQACQQSGAEAVHPGYGFLSENTRFAELLEEHGIVFIGPGARAIQAMGDKITSKRLAQQAGVNTIPGQDGVVPDADSAVAAAAQIGYPVMIKASAGGGGKGMRVARDDDQCRDGFIRATSEALSSFGDGRILMEKYVEQPRHIEIQIIADSHGNVVTLNERECSIQRRHQKVIEEAPSPFIDPGTRAAMSQQAIDLAKAVDYRSAGTVEFVVDGNRNFYFLEMNTRLQVEHPVTELITGLDLVELMIRVADGEKLPVTQEDIGIDGWAMEARIYAESPYRGFLPSTGRLRKYRPPAEGSHVRVDTGVVEGSEISMFYDPMISKLITWGETRERAIQSMRRSLGQYYIRGVDTNLPFVQAIMNHPRFQGGDISTDFIADEYPDGFPPQSLSAAMLGNLVPVMAAVHFRLMQRSKTITDQAPGYGRKTGAEWAVIIGRETHPVRIRKGDGSSSGGGVAWLVEYDGQEYVVEDEWSPLEVVYSGKVNGVPVDLLLERNGFSFDVTYEGCLNRVFMVTAQTAELNQRMPVKQAADQSRYLLSPMPGLLVSLSVEVGHTVKAGQELAVIEAMKMENSLRAEQDCVIREILVEAGSILEVDQPVMEFEAVD